MVPLDLPNMAEKVTKNEFPNPNLVPRVEPYHADSAQLGIAVSAGA